jgi:glycosyltransferase involved in cell wall biosynthesis
LPTFNREKMLKNAIDSVISQTYKKWELIVVDDGSTDNTKLLISSYIDSEPRIKYMFQKNSERSAARNNGIRKAKGEWVCFLDSDDTYHRNHLFEFYKLIEKSNCKKALYFCGVSYNFYSSTPFSYNYNYKNNIEFLLLNTIGTPRACVHRDVLLENKFNEKIRVGEDVELWIRIAKSIPIFFHTKNTFIELSHDDRTIFNNNTLQDISIRKKIIQQNKDSVRKKIRKKYISDAYFFKAKVNLRHKKIIGFIFFTLISIFTNLTFKTFKQRFIFMVFAVLKNKKL